MTKGFRFAVVVSLALLLIPGAVLCQTLTGTIKGRVVDSTGLPLPGVVVILNSPALITPNLKAVTNDRGEFRYPGLDPGAYQARAELMSFAPTVRTNIRVRVGGTTDVTLELQPEGVTTSIVVTAAGPMVDRENTTTGVSFTRDLLENIPSADRDLSDVFNFTPGVTGDSTRGSTVRGNAYQYDGVDISDPTVGTPFVFFNYDNFEEVAVETGGHSAEYGQVTGSVVNVVTKSGGNDFSGEANIYYKADWLTSTNGQDIVDAFPNLAPGGIIKGIDTQAQLGGPLKKDKVWFFGSWRYTSDDSNVVGFEDVAGNSIPFIEKHDYGFIKGTVQPSAKHKIVAGLNYTTTDRDNRGASALTTPESTRLQDSVSYTPNIEWTGIFTENTFAQVRYTGVDSDFLMMPKNELVSQRNVNTGEVIVSDGRFDSNFRNRKQLTGSVSHYREGGGTHDMKFGFEWENSDETRIFRVTRGGVDDPLLDTYDGLISYNQLADNDSWRPYYAVFYSGPPTSNNIDRLSFFAQDTWVVQDRLTFNLGARFDSYEGWFPEQPTAGGEILPAVNDVVNQFDISPRLGVAYDIGGTGKSVIRASYSRFVDALITQYFNSVNLNAISGTVRAYCSGSLGFFCSDQDDTFSTASLNDFGASNTQLDPDLLLPKGNEYMVGYEQELAPNLSFGVNYIEKDEFDLIEDINLREFVPVTAHDDGDWELDRVNDEPRTSPDPGQTWTIWDDAPGSEDQYVITNPELAEREYRGVEFVVNKRMSDRWQMIASAVIGRSSGIVGNNFADSTSITGTFDNPNTLINAEGRLSLNRNYQFKLQGTYQMPYGINLSGYYRLLSGRPYNRSIQFTGFDSDGDGEDDTPLSAGTITINGETRGNRTYPWLNFLDLRVEKEFGLPYGRLGLIFDVFNTFNISTQTNRRTRTTSSNNVFGDPLAYTGPREARLAARFIF